MLRKCTAGLAAVITLLLSPAFSQRILIDIGADQSKGGAITSSPDINGNTWNNMTSALPGIRVSNAVSTLNTVTTIGLEVINRLDGTYSTGQPGIGNGNNAVVVGDYPGSATTDHALVHSSAVNGKWKIFGLDPLKIYTFKFWGARTNTTAARSIEIKRADSDIWLSYNATGNINYNNAVVFTISGKAEISFDIRTKAGSDFSCINVLDISYGNETTGPPPNSNNPPVANAGNDITINLPADSTVLNGCASFDPENALMSYQWTKISGPDALIKTPLSCNTKLNNLTGGIYRFELAVKDAGNITVKDTVKVTVNNIMATPWPAAPIIPCQQPFNVVVIGSSSAYGTGATPLDSAWVNKFRIYLQRQHSLITVTNLATPGLTSYQVLPSSFIPPYNRPAPDPSRNITKALASNPHAIIINLPSNDVAMGYSMQECYDNFNRLAATADAQNVPVWVTTTQPRDRLSPAEKNLQMTLRDWIIQRFGNKSVDFWTTIGNQDGSMNLLYSAGDSVHQNNYGHHIMFTRMAEESIWDTICSRMSPQEPVNQLPVAKAGADKTIQLPVRTAFLDGRSSSDTDGYIVSYKWTITSGSSGSTLQSDTKDTTSVAFSTAGTYIIRLTVTDNSGSTASDEVTVNVRPAEQLPPPAGYGKTIRVNIYGGTNPYTNPAWNNWNSSAAIASSNFLYENGSASTVNATFNSQAGIADNGTGFGTAATICPAQVLRFNSFNTSGRTLNIKGLDASKSYALEFYGSRINTGNKTIININGISDTISTDNNISDFAKFTNIKPQSNGQLIVNLSRIGTYNYIAGFIITEINTAARGNTAVNEMTLFTGLPLIEDQRLAYPNPFSEHLTIPAGNETGPCRYRIINEAGTVVLTGNLPDNSTHSVNTRHLAGGIYVLTLTSKTRTESRLVLKR